MSVVTVTKDNFHDTVSASKGVVALDFWASWCAPCRALSPIVDSIAEELGSGYTVGKVNIDEEGDLASQFQVMSIPTVVVFRDGKEVNRSVGLVSKDKLMEVIKG